MFSGLKNNWPEMRNLVGRLSPLPPKGLPVLRRFGCAKKQNVLVFCHFWRNPEIWSENIAKCLCFDCRFQDFAKNVKFGHRAMFWHGIAEKLRLHPFF